MGGCGGNSATYDVHADRFPGIVYCLSLGWVIRSHVLQTMPVQWNLRFKTTALRDRPPMKDHFSMNLGLYFYTFIPLISYKTILVAPMRVLNHRFHCTGVYFNISFRRSLWLVVNGGPQWWWRESGSKSTPPIKMLSTVAMEQLQKVGALEWLISRYWHC